MNKRYEVIPHVTELTAGNYCTHLPSAVGQTTLSHIPSVTWCKTPAAVKQSERRGCGARSRVEKGFLQRACTINFVNAHFIPAIFESSTIKTSTKGHNYVLNIIK